MKSQFKEPLKWVLQSLLVLWGFFSLMILAGEDVPQMSIKMYILIKASALANFAICFFVGRWLGRRGMLPDLEDE
jgi:hypothetical protein